MLHDPVAGALVGHLARTNTQSRDTMGEVLVIVRGPDAYVSPSWYATKAEHGRVVPTWDYVVAHVHGELVTHEDPEWLAAHVRRLTEVHEGGRPVPWSVDDAPERFVAGQLRAIIGVEVRISRVEAKWKLSQNRPGADVDGVVRGLAADGRQAVADLVEQARRRG
jgi:transcriptional regulator